MANIYDCFKNVECVTQYGIPKINNNCLSPCSIDIHTDPKYKDWLEKIRINNEKLRIKNKYKTCPKCNKLYYSIHHTPYVPDNINDYRCEKCDEIEFIE
jgi:ribosomal protein S27AE